MRKRTAVVCIVILSFLTAGCMTTNHAIRFPKEILFQPQPQIAKQPFTIGIFVSPEDKAQPFDQCEKLTGGSMCYHGTSGTLLEPTAYKAFQQNFEKVVLLDSREGPEAQNVDFVVVLSYEVVRLDTTVKGFTATRKVTVALREQVFSGPDIVCGGRSEKTCSCLAFKCNLEGRDADVGITGGQVVLGTLFVPGYIAGIGGRYGKIVATAYSASLKAALVELSDDLASKAAGLKLSRRKKK